MIWVKNIMAIMLLATAAWLGSILYSQIGAEDKNSEINWQVFSEAEAKNLAENGQVVLVDITAKWCVNCQVNKARVLDDAEMVEFFAAEKVALMRGDMTRPSQELLDYIRKFGRTGIPFNAVYGHGIEPILLSPILSIDDTKAAILQAKSK